jgi:hypothetical protein
MTQLRKNTQASTPTKRTEIAPEVELTAPTVLRYSSRFVLMAA